jgi:hypothetical protein
MSVRSDCDKPAGDERCGAYLLIGSPTWALFADLNVVHFADDPRSTSGI